MGHFETCRCIIWGLHFQIFNVVYVHLIIYKATFSSQLFILWQSDNLITIFKKHSGLCNSIIDL